MSEEQANKLISDLVFTWEVIPDDVTASDYDDKWIAYLEARDRMMDALLANQPDPTYPPVSGGSPEMDDDDTACGALCQEANDAAWAKLGPVDEAELPF